MDMMEWTVNEALRTAPQLMGIFNRLALDTCCGGTLTLGEAARSVGLTPDELRTALEPALEAKHR
jgi:iron-sulfur cluster repair protein YtfE (RIC family)